jgi:hypothetical protein
MRSTVEGLGNIIASNLVLYLDVINSRSYPGTGTTWFDLSGNNNNFTLSNSPTYVGKYFSFLTNQSATCINTTCGNFGANSFTIEYVTYYTGSSNQDALIYKRGGVLAPGTAGSPGWAFRNGANAWWVQDSNPGGTVNVFTNVVGTTGALTGSTSVVHMAYTIERNGTQATGSSYTNGVLTFTDKKNFIGSNTVDTSNAIVIASNFTGSIAMVRLYNTKLSAIEVKQNYQATKNRFII